MTKIEHAHNFPLGRMADMILSSTDEEIFKKMADESSKEVLLKLRDSYIEAHKKANKQTPSEEQMETDALFSLISYFRFSASIEDITQAVIDDVIVDFCFDLFVKEGGMEKFIETLSYFEINGKKVYHDVDTNNSGEIIRFCWPKICDYNELLQKDESVKVLHHYFIKTIDENHKEAPAEYRKDLPLYAGFCSILCKFYGYTTEDALKLGLSKESGRVLLECWLTECSKEVFDNVNASFGKTSETIVH